MCSIFKALLLLAVVVYISTAQLNESKEQCLCQRMRNNVGNSKLKDIQIYPATIFCNQVEIVVTANNGLRYCLNPKSNNVIKLLRTIIKKKNTTTTTSSPRSTNTPDI
ncbi:C-X-C motif chemokine 10-like [Mastacembelus armatus]|uniref:C-X-C motif chemokine 10-like n=1 Tax=Mastacembelus armatus TaxID=205130 RepID=A0A3Q3LPD1_9TELE|nr:C-X-C motif chemokine 10-like [Mastacembelus armatus]